MSTPESRAVAAEIGSHPFGQVIDAPNPLTLLGRLKTIADRLGAGGDTGGGATIDRELLVTTYQAKAAFAGASVGDTVTAIRVLDVGGASATQVGATLWRNETTAQALAAAPAAASLSLTGAGALTEAQLRSAAVNVAADALPLPAGAATQATLAAVLAKLVAAPATEVNQATANTRLAGMVDQLATLIGQTDQLEAQGASTLAGLAALLTGIVLAAGEAHIGAVGGHSRVAVASFARPADTVAYAAGDLIAASTAAATVNAAPVALNAARVAGGTGSIRRVRVSRTGVGPGTDAVRVHLFRGPPTVGAGDNAALTVNGIGAIHLGHADVTLDRVFTDGCKGIGVPTIGGEITFDAAAGSTQLYLLIEARSAIVPVAGETVTVAVEMYLD